jgi:hypothetical protein
MGRFYRTAKSIFLDDKMFQLPAELMSDVIKSQDQRTDENLEKVNAFGDALEIQNLDTDDPQVNEQMANYQSQIQGITEEIYQNPLNYRTQIGKINNLSRKIDQDLQRGILGRAQQQKTDFDTEMARIAELKNVSSDKKDLVKKLVQQRYSQSGGLNFQDENTYNKISDNFETPLEDVNTDELINTIATNFQADKTATASSGPGGGYIWTSKGTVEIRSEDDVASYMENALRENGWEDQLRQELGWRAELGEDINVEEELTKRKQEVIDAAKNKLGYRQETSSKSASPDSIWMYKQKKRDEQVKIGQGGIVTDNRDYRKTITANGTRKYDDATIKNFETKTKPKMEALFVKLNIQDMEQLKRDYFINGNLNSIREDLAAVGLDKYEVGEYITYLNDDKTLKTPHIPGYDRMTEEQKANNPNIVRQQEAYLKQVVEAVNNMGSNDRVKKIIVHEDGVPKEMPYNTMAELIQDDDNYVYIPATGSIKDTEAKKSSEGYLLNSYGELITDAEGNPIKSVAEAKDLNKMNEVTYEPKSIPTYDTNEKLMKFDVTNVRQNDNFIVKSTGTVDTSSELIANNRYFKVNKETGERKLIETELVIDKKDLDVKF